MSKLGQLGGVHIRARQKACMPLSEKRLLDVDELMVYIGMGRNKTVEFAVEINAERKIGRRSLYDRVVIDKHFDDLMEG